MSRSKGAICILFFAVLMSVGTEKLNAAGAVVVERSGSSTRIQDVQIFRSDSCTGFSFFFENVPRFTTWTVDHLPIYNGSYTVNIPLVLVRHLVMESDKFQVDLADGSFLKGTVKAAGLRGRTDFGTFEVNFSGVKEVTFENSTPRLITRTVPGRLGRVVLPDGKSFPFEQISLVQKYRNRNHCLTGEQTPESALHLLMEGSTSVRTIEWSRVSSIIPVSRKADEYVSDGQGGLRTKMTRVRVSSRTGTELEGFVTSDYLATGMVPIQTVSSSLTPAAGQQKVVIEVDFFSQYARFTLDPMR